MKPEILRPISLNSDSEKFWGDCAPREKAPAQEGPGFRSSAWRQGVSAIRLRLHHRCRAPSGSPPEAPQKITCKQMFNDLLAQA